MNNFYPSNTLYPSTTLYPTNWITPVTTWTIFDYLNFSDLNRIENNLYEIRQLLVTKGYTVPAMTFVTNRTLSTADYVYNINNIENNLNGLKTVAGTPSNWQTGKTWTYQTPLTASDVSRWESNIQGLGDLVSTL